MKRFVGGLLVIVVAALGMTSVASASTDDFVFKSFHADYYLGADSDGRSTLKTVETLVAEFPKYDQNHGIERAIPKSYDGHTTSLKIASVTDGTGKALPYTTYDDDSGNEVVRIGDADTYVHNEQTYVVTYAQRDVTKYFANVPDHEFYWDTNGTQWGQAFADVSVTVHTDKNIQPTLNKKVACYQGYEGSTQPCDIKEGADGTITASSKALAPEQNMTIAIGFTAGTFRAYQPSLWEIIVGLWLISLVVTSVLGIVAIVWLSTRYRRLSNRNRELPPIPVEYIPPSKTSVQVAAQIGDGTRATTTAQIMDLAVRHYITISQTSEKSLFKAAEYDLEIVKSMDDLLDEERDFVLTLFSSWDIGTILRSKSLKKNYSIGTQLQAGTQLLIKRIKGDYGYRAKNVDVSRSFKKSGLVLVILGIATVSPVLFVAGVVAYGIAWTITPLTDKGLDLRRYLAGLKVYIELAEKDRIKALQSPEGAEKSGVKIKGDGDKKLIHLYERVLPYAVLFGQEKEWNKQLANRYETAGQQPDWYVGQGAFNAVVFTGAMNDFSSSMSSYGSSTSSSSGGSGGGGFSGGGGGGGGGGGW
ncbi:MAG: hypothetical protein JWO07_353 [Candidatus Saccharibacteria bacterium]|nr:hypothetical protein [Candidatus Saccharibacteria bacterium]